MYPNQVPTIFGKSQKTVPPQPGIKNFVFGNVLF